MGEAVGGAIPMFRPSFVDSDYAALSGLLATGMVARGATARRFEERIADRVGSEAALTTSSGTAASSLAFAALGIGAGDEVLTPSLTCLGVVNAIARTGATPVFVDIDPDTLTMDPDAAAPRHRPHARPSCPFTMRVIPPISMRSPRSPLSTGSRDHRGHRPRARRGLRGRPLGSSGNLGILSFHGTKIITTGEGGALIGPHDLLEGARLDTNFGVVPGEHPSGFPEDSVAIPGLKVGMSDLQAALGLSQLARLDELLAARRRTADFYNERFAANPALRIPTEARTSRRRGMSTRCGCVRRRSLRRPRISSGPCAPTAERRRTSSFRPTSHRSTAAHTASCP